jgi:hypothetical protein
LVLVDKVSHLRAEGTGLMAINRNSVRGRFIGRQILFQLLKPDRRFDRAFNAGDEASDLL